MRFIGSKTLLLDHISEIIESNISQQQQIEVFKFFRRMFYVMSHVTMVK